MGSIMGTIEKKMETTITGYIRSILAMMAA